MAIARIEPTGCCVHKGKIQLRFSFYLEPSDPRYEEHHIKVPIIPAEGYPGEVDAMGNLVNIEDYINWTETLPKEWQNNPFHNHFVYVDADVTDGKIKQLIRESYDEFFGIWGKGKDILKVWRPEGKLVPGDMSANNINKCQNKVTDITKRVKDFELRRV